MKKLAPTPKGRPMKNRPIAVARRSTGNFSDRSAVAVGTSVASPVATNGRTAARVRKERAMPEKAVNALHATRPAAMIRVRP